MVDYINLEAKSSWIEVKATTEDWEKADKHLLENMLVQLHLIRAFEEIVLELAGDGLVHGPAHSSIGQEGGAVGSIIDLTAQDQVNGSHRGHHQFLAKVLTYLYPKGIALNNLSDIELRKALQKTLSEILGLADGFCKGRGGSMHLQWIEAGAMGTNAIVGGGAPMAAGAAWADKYSGSQSVAVTYFGDGAINIGSVLETMNLAAAWALPICFFVENNRYAVSTVIEEVTAETRLSSRGLAFNIPSWKVDGMDPLAVHLTMKKALEHMRNGKGPTLIEADVYRFYHQNGPYPGSAFGYRSKEEEQEWKARDPIALLETKMISLKSIDQDSLIKLRKECQTLMKTISDELLDYSNGEKQIKAELWPSKDFVDVGIRGDLSEISQSDIDITEEREYQGELIDQKFIDAVAQVMDRRMENDPNIVLMGEDIHRLRGGEQMVRQKD